MSADDVTALNKIYETSPWTFRNSKLDLKAKEGGAVELKLEGVATRKANDSGPIWIPVAVISELPDYFEGTDLTTSKTIEIEAYRVPGSLWLITVVIPEPLNTTENPPAANQSTPNPTPAPTVTPTSTPEAVDSGNPSSTSGTITTDVESPLSPPIDVKVRVVMVSPKFLTGFPFLVPSGQGHAAVATTVQLPQSASFSTLKVTSNDRRDSSALTVLPASLTGSDKTAAIRLSPTSGLAWNFSGVTYSGQTFGQWRRWFTPSAVLITLIAFIWVWQKQYIHEHQKRSSELRQKRRELLAELQAEKDIWFAGRSGLEADLDMKWKQILFELERDPSYSVSLEQQIEIVEKQSEIKEKLSKEFEALKGLYQSREAPAELFRTNLERVSANLARIEQLNADINKLHNLREEKGRGLWILLALTLGSVIWLLSTVATAQTKSQTSSNKPAVTRLATLAELRVDVLPQNPLSDNYDKVNVNLSFFPLTEVQGKKSLEEIGIGVSNETRLTIDPIQLPPNSPARLIQETGRLVRLNVPVIHAPVIQRWKALADWKPIDFSATAEYFKNLDAASKVNLTYSIKGAQRVSQRTKGKFFHWFPFDTAEVQFPLDLRQPAIVSEINLQPPTSEYVTSPSLEGLNNPFVEDESGRSYRSVSKEKDGRAAIWANKPVKVNAIFQRPTSQRILLTVGQAIIALIVGVVAGWGMTLPEKGWAKAIIGLAGLLGLPFALRSAVLSKYQNLPSLLTGSGVTLFEVVFLASVVLIALVSWFAYRKFS